MTEPHDPRRRRDQGFTLIEVIVAFGLFAVMVAALLSLVLSSQRLSYEDAARTAANNLASRELEITRDALGSRERGFSAVQLNRVVNPNPLPDGTLTVDGTTFTVVRTAQYAAVGSSAASTCDEASTARLEYLRVRVDVSWPALGDRPPVTMSSLMATRAASQTGARGSVALKVIGRNGQPRPNVAVTAVSGSFNQTASTSAEGCVVFGFVPVGSYTLTLNQASEANPNWDQASTINVSVASGQLVKTTTEYDRASTVVAAFSTAPNHAVPIDLSAVPITFANSNLLPSGIRVVPGAGQARVISGIYPAASGYGLWAGSCADSSAAAGRTSVATNPGVQTPGATVLLAPVVVRGAPNIQIKAVHAADTACASPVTVVLGSTDGSGILRTSLPWGTWTISRNTTGAAGTSVTLTSATSAPTVTLP